MLQVDILEEWKQTTSSVSQSYPGLSTQYVFHNFSLKCADLAAYYDQDFQTTEDEGGGKLVRFKWTW